MHGLSRRPIWYCGFLVDGILVSRNDVGCGGISGCNHTGELSTDKIWDGTKLWSLYVEHYGVRSWSTYYS